MPERVEIAELLDEYVVCRTLGHSWDDFPTGEIDGDWARASVGMLMLRCTRCHTERFDYIAKDLSVAHRHYRYPARYTSVPGEGTRPNLRGELLRRSLLIHAYGRRNGRR